MSTDAPFYRIANVPRDFAIATFVSARIRALAALDRAQIFRILELKTNEGTALADARSHAAVARRAWKRILAMEVSA